MAVKRVRGRRERRQRAQMAAIILGLLIALPFAGNAAALYDFSSSPFSGTVQSFTMGTSSTGLSFQISGGDGGEFEWHSSGGDNNTAAIFISSFARTSLTEKITIESRDGKAFVFTYLYADVDSAWTITGIGPEPFTISVPSSSRGGAYPPGDHMNLVTRVEITTQDFDQACLDTVNAFLDVPGAAVYGNNNLITLGDTSPSTTDGTDMGITEAGTLISQDFELRNLGDATLVVDSTVTVSGTGFSITQQPASSIAAGGSSIFTVQFNPSAAGVATGTVTISNNSAADDYTFQVKGEGDIDTTKPDVTINRASSQADPTNGSPINFTVVFNEAVTGFTTGDVALGGTAEATTAIVTGSGTTYNVLVCGMATHGTVTATIPPGVAQDASGNTNNFSTSTDNSVLYDCTPPTDPVLISATHVVGMWSNHNTVAILVSCVADAGSGVDGYEVEWNQCDLWAPTGIKEHSVAWWQGDTYTATSDGDWYFHIVTVDNAGNWSSGTTLGPFRIDTTPPSVPTGLSPTNGSYSTDTSPLLSWTASTDTGSGIDNYRIVVTGPVNRDTHISDTDYNPSLNLEGTYTWKVYARDNAGHVSGFTPETTLIIDATQPDVTIDQADGQADPTTSSPILFTAVFDEPINDETLTSADINVAGTATTGAVTVMEIAPNDDTTFEVSIVVTGDGTVIPTIPAGGAEDPSGNTNTASTSTDNSVTYDGTRPNVTVNQAVGQADPTNGSPVIFSVTIDDNSLASGASIDWESFSEASVVFEGTATIDDWALIASPDFDIDAFEIVLQVDVIADGTVVPRFPAGAFRDKAGNMSNASTSTDNEVTFDVTPPTISIGAPSDTAANTGPVTYIVTYGGADVVTLAAGDIMLNKTGTANGTVDVSGSGTASRTVTVSDLTGEGTLGIYVANSGSGTDEAGNPSPEAGPSATFIVDNTPPIDPPVMSWAHRMNTWSRDNTIDIEIAEDPADLGGSGIDGFEVEWDKNATWTPTQTKDHEETWAGATYTATSDGDWYFHLATVDNAGNWAIGTTYGPIRIDTTAPINPTLDCTSHTAGVWSNNDYVTLYDYTTSFDTGSGVDGYAALWTTTPALPPLDFKNMEEVVLNTASHRPDGDWYYHIATVDNAGNWSNKETYGPYRIDTVAPTNPVLICTTHTVDVWSSEDELIFDDFGTADDALSGVFEFWLWWVQDGGAVPGETPIPGEVDTVGVSTVDGIWYLDCETRDAAGNASTPLHFGPFKIDTTAPVISDAPSDQAITIAHGSSSGVVSWEEPTAVDAGCGLATLTATHNSGDSFSVGTTTVTYTATDVLGNTSTASFDVVVTEGERRFSVEPASESGSFLDRCLDLEEGEEPPMVGLRPLTAIYESGEAVGGACSILNPGGQPVRGCYIHVYIYRVNLDEHPETVSLLDHWVVGYDSEAGAYCYSWDTAETAPGTYDIYLAFPDGSGHTCRIQLTESVE